MLRVVVIQLVFLTLIVLQPLISAETNNGGLFLFYCNDILFPKPTDPCVERCTRTPRRNDYTYTPGIGAHKFITQRTDWNTARRTCEQDGAYLVIINSVAEAELVSRLLNGTGIQYYYSWVGVHDLYHEDEFVTIHGDPLVHTGYNKWQPGEPNNANNNENCLLITYERELVDIPCSDRRSFVCEMP